MKFYKESFNGEITVMQTYGDSSIDVPEAFENRIFNSELKAGGTRFKASDDLPGHEVKMGTNISIYGVFGSKQTQEEVFRKLSEGGKVLFPLEDNFGMLKDKYGVQWMLVQESN